MKSWIAYIEPISSIRHDAIVIRVYLVFQDNFLNMKYYDSVYNPILKMSKTIVCKGFTFQMCCAIHSFVCICSQISYAAILKWWTSPYSCLHFDFTKSELVEDCNYWSRQNHSLLLLLQPQPEDFSCRTEDFRDFHLFHIDTSIRQSTLINMGLCWPALKIPFTMTFLS